MGVQGTVGVVTTHIAPSQGYGGPAVSVANLVRVFSKRGVRTLVCSSDASLGARLRPTDVSLDSHVNVSLYRSRLFKRWGFGFGALTEVFGVVRHASWVYVNGIATWPTTIGALVCAIIGRPFVVALRGGLMPEHIEYITRSKLHKWFYYRLLTFPALKRAKLIHCSSLLEAHAARRYLGENAQLLVAPNGIDTASIGSRLMPQRSELVLCYVGRISPEKGINAFIDVWQASKQDNERLVVAGDGSGPYFKQFLSYVRQAQGAIEFRGYLGKEAVAEVVGESHFLVLPSGLGTGDVRENFGNSIAEALAHGRPVLVTKGLAWDNLEDHGAGICFDRSESGVETALERIRSLKAEVRVRMGEAARRYAVEHLDIESVASALLEAMTNKNKPPPINGEHSKLHHAQTYPGESE